MDVEHHDEMVMLILSPIIIILYSPIEQTVAFVFKIYYNTIKNEVFYEERRDMHINPQTTDLKEISPRNHCK